QLKDPNRDHYGDPLPEGALARIGTVRFRHGDQIRAVAFAADGRALVSAGMDSRIVLWEVPTGKRLREFEGHERIVSSVALTPDGKHVLSLGGDLTIRLWDVATARELRRWPTMGGGALAVARDGTIVAGL